MKSRIAVAACVFAVANIATFLWVLNTRFHGRANGIAKEIRHPDLGRVQAEIISVPTREEHELIAALDLELVVNYSGVDGADINPMLDLPLALADSNLQKLDEIVGTYPQEERRQRVDGLFSMVLERQIALTERALKSLDHPPPFYSNPADIPKPKPIIGRRIAVCGVLLLAAKYCGVADVRAKLKRIRKYADALPVRIQAKPYADDIILELMPQAFLPDDEFVVNVLLFAVLHDRSLTGELRDNLDGLVISAVNSKIIERVDAENGRSSGLIGWYQCVGSTAKRRQLISSLDERIAKGQ